jgi:putative FmdB family regulatory protein
MIAQGYLARPVNKITQQGDHFAMPTYEYQCDACEHQFEEFQSINAERLKKCPKCGKKKLRRLIGGGAAILFKGSGFYQTDYRSDSYKQSAKKDENAPASSDGKASGDTTSTNGKVEPTANKSTGESKAKTGKNSKSES